MDLPLSAWITMLFFALVLRIVFNFKK